MMRTISISFLFLLMLCSCSLHPASFMPTVSDDRLESFLAGEAAKILEVSENADSAPLYRFYLVKFRREDILGLSLGNHQIFMSYELSHRAYEQKSYRWLFRQTLAHEIAHDVLGAGNSDGETGLNSVSGSTNRVTERDLGLPRIFLFRNYSRTAELAADQKAMEYWQKMGWDCHIWIEIFKNFLENGYIGDADHPTDERLSQAMKICHSEQ